MSLEVDGAPHGAESYLGTRLGWGALRVLGWMNVEAISELYRAEVLVQPAPNVSELELQALLGGGATLRIRTGQGYRAVHGLVARVEEQVHGEVGPSFRIVLVPHLARASLRRANQVFRDKSIVDIISAVLRHDTPARPRGTGGLEPLPQGTIPSQVGSYPDFEHFEEPTAWFRWVLGPESARLREASYREHVTQYEESDFDFFARLCEEEGLFFFFEHGASESVLTITDSVVGASIVHPLYGAELQGPSNLRAGGSVEDGRFGAELVTSYRPAQSLRSRAVRVRGYRPDAPPMLSEALELGPDAGPEALGESLRAEYPAGQGNVATEPWRTRARHGVERLDAAAQLGAGTTTVRSLVAGARLHVYEPGACAFRAGVAPAEWRPEPAGTVGLVEQLLVVRLHVTAHEPGFAGGDGPAEGDYCASFTALPVTARLRPARTRFKPRVWGVQEAIVTAEEHAGSREINVNANGDCRVRFAWDERPPEPGVASSRWVRVTQPWGGQGYGALWHPRVGDLVGVAFREGDLDDPVVVGRAYSKHMPPPYSGEALPTVSTFKSRSCPGGTQDEYNELLFDDAQGAERIELHAQRDLRAEVHRDATVVVGRDSSVSIGRNRLEVVKGNERLEVSGNLDVAVDGALTASANSVLVQAATGVEVVARDHVLVSAPSVTVSAGEIVLASDGASIRIAGGNIDITASGNVTVNGALIKLN